MVDLTKLHPELLVAVQKVLAAMKVLGYDMKICQGARTTEQQQALYAQGRTMPGMRVTDCDGIHSVSNHQVQKDGWGHAVDCCFEGAEPFPEKGPWRAYGEAGKAVGLEWGGDWAKPDRPHLQLPLSVILPTSH